MKLDVSYTDHSHIIGKGGLTIKRVMEETGCHIHFPDSNRSNHQDKSNQVSIAGEMEGVERARARVRVSFLTKSVPRVSRKSYILPESTDDDSRSNAKRIVIRVSGNDVSYSVRAKMNICNVSRCEIRENITIFNC